MARTNNSQGGFRSKRSDLGSRVALAILITLLATIGPARARSGTQAPPAAAETAEDRLVRLRNLDPERNPIEFIELGNRALFDLEGSDQPALKAEIRCGVGRALLVDNRFEEARIESRRAADQAKRTGQIDLQVRSLIDEARASFYLGDFHRSLAVCREALDEPGIGDEPDRSWRFLNIMAAAQLQKGDYGDAIETGFRALEMRQGAGDRHAEAILLNNIGVAHMYLGDNEQALKLFQRARVIKSELGETDGVADMLANIGDIKHLQGHHDEAIKVHLEALALREAEGDERRLAQSYRSLAAAQQAAGRNNEALDRIASAMEIQRRLGLKPEIVTSLSIEARALASLRRGPEAVAAATEGLELARSMGMISREIIALDALIEAQVASGNTELAFAAQQRARELENELHSTEIRNEFAKFQAAFEARENEQEIELLRKNNELQELELRHHRLWRISFVVGLVLLAIIAWVGWHRFLTRRRENLERQQADAALLRSVERYRRLFENNLAGVFQADLNGEIRTANQAFATMLGYADIDEIGGKSIADLSLEPDEIRRFLDELTTAGRVHNREFAMATRDGEPVTILMNAGRITETRGDERFIEAIAIDVSDRNRAEEVKRRLEMRTRQSQKLESLGVLAGGIAHDFNNMLMAILSNISLAKRRATSEDETLSRLNEAQEVCLKATSLTQQLLTFSKGGRPIRKIASIGRLIEEATATAARGGNCHYDCRCNPDLWPVEVDEGQVTQVIQNLVLNSIEAMPRGGTVSVTVDNAHLTEGDVPTLEAGRFVLIEVVDTGVGIPDNTLESIFDPFFTTKQGGSGLGLATAFSIVRSHGGAIVVHSEPDRGSRFAVYLPASEQDRSVAATDAGELVQGHGRLLIMDDDEAVRSAASELLETIGYEVDTAADGAEAIDRYREAMEAGQRYRAVILDLTVPSGVGGRETMARLLEIDPGVNAIVSSGYSTDPVMANYREHGFSGVAVKPYRLADLARTLNITIKANAEG